MSIPFLERATSCLVRKRLSFAITILFLYSIPQIALAIIALRIATVNSAWTLFSAGIFMAMVGTLLFLILWQLRESQLLSGVPHSDDQPSPQENHEKILHFQEHLEDYDRQRLELQIKEESISRLTREVELYRHAFEEEKKKGGEEISLLLEQLNEQKRLLDEYQKQIAGQQRFLATAEQREQELENKIRDLSCELQDQKYELKTLLKINDMDSEEPLEELPLPFPPLEMPPQEDWIRSSGEGLLLLKRCLEASKKITAPSYYTPLHAPLGHAASTSHPLDLSRLCDALQGERGAAIILYDPKMEKVLFATPAIEQLTGWQRELWMNEWKNLLNGAIHEWKGAIQRLNIHSDIFLHLSIPTKSGEQKQCQSYFAAIPSGLFKNHVIILLFPQL